MLVRQSSGLSSSVGGFNQDIMKSCREVAQRTDFSYCFYVVYLVVVAKDSVHLGDLELRRKILDNLGPKFNLSCFHALWFWAYPRLLLFVLLSCPLHHPAPEPGLVVSICLVASPTAETDGPTNIYQAHCASPLAYQACTLLQNL